MHALVRLFSGTTCRDSNLVGHDKRGIKTDTELTDQVRILLLVAAQFGKEFPRARLGNRAQIIDDLVAAHADAVVADRQRAGILVVADADLQIGIAFEQRGVVQRLEAQFVASIRRVGDQLAQENLAVGIQRMDHQLQKLFDFRLKPHRFAIGYSILGHTKSPK